MTDPVTDPATDSATDSATHVVVSQTWLRPGDDALAGYLAELERMDGFLAARPGFVSRRMLRSVERPTHLIHLREFERVADYEAMVAIPEYREHIAALSEFVDASAYPDGVSPREYTEVVFETRVGGPADG